MDLDLCGHYKYLGFCSQAFVANSMSVKLQCAISSLTFLLKNQACRQSACRLQRGNWMLIGTRNSLGRLQKAKYKIFLFVFSRLPGCSPSFGCSAHLSSMIALCWMVGIALDHQFLLNGKTWWHPVRSAHHVVQHINIQYIYRFFEGS